MSVAQGSDASYGFSSVSSGGSGGGSIGRGGGGGDVGGGGRCSARDRNKGASCPRGDNVYIIFLG